ncbi:hypothetical protein DVH05_023550 [Phytophthora capsici]|nr:hypothetical protein DVH05_023550 [Phytophthora capsici]
MQQNDMELSGFSTDMWRKTDLDEARLVVRASQCMLRGGGHLATRGASGVAANSLDLRAGVTKKYSARKQGRSSLDERNAFCDPNVWVGGLHIIFPTFAEYSSKDTPSSAIGWSVLLLPTSSAVEKMVEEVQPETFESKGNRVDKKQAASLSRGRITSRKGDVPMWCR